VLELKRLKGKIKFLYRIEIYTYYSADNIIVWQATFPDARNKTEAIFIVSVTKAPYTVTLGGSDL